MKDGAVYEDMMEFKTLKKYMEDQLEDYNMEPGVIAMDLVLFRDAIEHGTVNDHIFILFIMKGLFALGGIVVILRRGRGRQEDLFQIKNRAGHVKMEDGDV